MAAAGLVALTNVKSASGIQSVGGSAETTTEPPGTTPTNPNAAQTQQQIRGIEIRLDDDALLTGAAVKQLMTTALSTDEDITLQITSNQNQLKQIGAIA